MNADLERSFGGFVARVRRTGGLVVQPRMGMSSPREMRAGLLATRRARASTAGTITLDSYTRIGDDDKARAALETAAELNGYPIVAHRTATTRAVLEGIAGIDFPVQVRHGSPCPQRIIRALMNAGLHATEGGPVSYCLPYSRMPLGESVRNWERGCGTLAELRGTGVQPHLETFGGCMLGQLCPPGLLVAMSVLECLFFRQHGVRSVSLSYAQQTDPGQDLEAITALRRLAAEMLSDIDYHVVVYAYMGVYPRTAAGAGALLAEAAGLAVRSGASRLIVKTAAEAHRIPTVADNVLALELADSAVAAAAAATPAATGSDRPMQLPQPASDTGIYAEARALIDAVLNLGSDLGRAFTRAFRSGYLDIPFCLHPDNAGRSRSRLGPDGRLHWSAVGSMPIARGETTGAAELTSSELLASLSYTARKYDALALGGYPAVPAQDAGQPLRELKGAKHR
jgi:methylaspartate mutase epsilon subunit